MLFGGAEVNILILSCRVGEGHNTAAKALVQAAESMGHTVFFEDYLSLASVKASNFLNSSYVRTVKTFPKCFGMVYFSGVYVSKRLHPKDKLSPIYKWCSHMGPTLRDYIDKNRIEGILCTHIFPAETLTYMKKQGESLPPFFLVSTDYACYPFMEETDCDGYILGHEDMIEVCTARGLRRETLYPLGIPLDAKFAELPTKAEARAQLSLSADAAICLLMGGSMGAGKLNKLLSRLLKKTEASAVIICGNNKKMEEKLTRKYKHESRVRVVGFTEQIPLYMRACDLLFSKPGGLSSTEALACAIPIVHTAAIPGCESDNIRWFGEKGLSRPAPKIGEQLRLGASLLADSEARTAMAERQTEAFRSHASEAIVRLLESMLQARS